VRPEIRIADTITKLLPEHRGRVLVAASHAGLYPAHLAAKGGLRGIVLSDAGVGRDGAGIAGLAALDAVGLPAATVSHRSARIGDGQDLYARGIISHVNRAAERLGCVTGMTCAECAERLCAAAVHEPADIPVSEARQTLALSPANRPVVLLDSNALVQPEDAGAVVVTGSHGGLLGGRPETAIRVDAFAALYNDAGVGIDAAGIGRLPALDARGIAGATVEAASARIGIAASTYEDGIVSYVNETARALGGRPGMAARDLVALLARAPSVRDDNRPTPMS